MSKPNWLDALEGEKEKEPKRAVILCTDASGQSHVVGVAEGAEAEAVIARAQETGVEVRRNAPQLDELLQPASAESNVPPEIYELMSTIISFAQELNEQWVRPQGVEELPES